MSGCFAPLPLGLPKPVPGEESVSGDVSMSAERRAAELLPPSGEKLFRLVPLSPKSSAVFL